MLTPAQTQDLLNHLFARRAERHQEQPLADSALRPQPIWAPFIAVLPQPLAQRPMLGVAAALIVILLLLWLVI